MKRKNKQKNPVEHEEKYIQFLEKQIEYHKKTNAPKDEIKKLKTKLSKARLVLKLLTSQKS